MRCRKQVQLPIKYVETTVVACDGCGVEAAFDELEGWVAVHTYEAPDSSRLAPEGEFCPSCRVKVLVAIGREVATLKAEKLQAAAEQHGVT